MPNALISNDPIVSQNFFLEIDGNVVSILSSVSGLDIEMEVVTMEQAGANGKVQVVKTLGKANKAPDLSLTRMAPPDMTQDKLWGWFNDIRDKGILLSDRSNNRKNGSIVMYDSTNAEIARFNFTNGWPSKISTDQLSVESNDPVKETITLTVESFGESEVSLTTQYEFTLPRGYLDRDGEVHRKGLMRLATARDELEPLRDPTVSGPDDPRLTVLILARVVDQLGTLTMVTPHEIEGLFAADLAFLQDFYGVINFGNQQEYEELLAAQAESAPLIGVSPPSARPTNGGGSLGEASGSAAGGNGGGLGSTESRPVLRARVEEIPRVPV